MGRTTQTMTQLVAQEEACWAPFRRALRREDQRVFDRLFAAARHHTAAAHYASHATPFDAILLAMMLETMKAVEALARRLDALAASSETADAPRGALLPNASG
jgi:hypothetical protein